MKKNSMILILFLISFVTFGQSKYHISFNETITLKKIESNTTFTISSEFGTVNLIGHAINDYKFKKPGIYLIKVFQPKITLEEECNHAILPSEITVNVSYIKMKFDQNKLELSQLIQKNTDTSGIQLSIPVTIQTFDNKPVIMDLTPINSSGIGTSITATLRDEFRLLPSGKHLLVYDLKGIATENSYIMFDFMEANGKVQAISLKSPIQD